MKNIFRLIGIGLITGALMWGLVQAGGVQVNPLPSTSQSGTTVTTTATLWEFNRQGLNADSEVRIYESFTDGSNFERFEMETGGNSINLVARSQGSGAQLTMNVGTLGASTLNLVQDNANALSMTGGNLATFDRAISTSITQAANDLAGTNWSLGAGQGGDCVACEESSPNGGSITITAGNSGAGSGSIAAGSGSSLILRGGNAGADGGAGGGQGGQLILSAGAESNGSGVDGQISIGFDNPGIIAIGGTEVRIDSPQGFSDGAQTLGAAAATFVAGRNFETITGDAGGNTVTTITGGVTGQLLTLLFVDTDVTISNNDAHTADTIDLSAAFISADDTTLSLLYNGTSWYEISRSVN